jgi:hypothetical protein
MSEFPIRQFSKPPGRAVLGYRQYSVVVMSRAGKALERVPARAFMGLAFTANLQRHYGHLTSDFFK